MFTKIWKKLFLVVLIIACLFNIVIKLVRHNSLEKELESSAQYVQEQQLKEKNK